jgi:hypothetical protein
MTPRANVLRHLVTNCTTSRYDRLKNERDADNILDTLLAMPPNDRVWLAEQLLLQPPIDAVKNALPLVLYFASAADRQEMIDAVHAAKPGMVAHAIPDQET